MSLGLSGCSGCSQQGSPPSEVKNLDAKPSEDPSPAEGNEAPGEGAKVVKPSSADPEDSSGMEGVESSDEGGMDGAYGEELPEEGHTRPQFDTTGQDPD